MTELDKFLMECHAVASKRTPEITGLSLARMRLAADAASVEVVADGKELKVVPLF